MTTPTTRFAFLLTLVLGGLTADVVAAPQSGADVFWQKFVNDIAIGDPQLLMQDVRKYSEDAIWSLPRQTQAYTNNQSPEQATRIEKLIQAWKDAFKNNFLDKYYEDLRGNDQGQWNEYNKALGRFNNLMIADQKRRKNELDEAAIDKFTAEAADVAGTFEVLGDKYVAGSCFYWAGASLDPDQRAKGSDIQRSIEFYEKTCKLREQLDFKDSFYSDLMSHIEQMKAAAKKGGTAKKDPKDPRPGGGAQPLGGSELFAKNSSWVMSPAKFAIVMPDEIERPGWNTDGNYIDWLTVVIDGKPGPAANTTLPFFSFKDAKFIREESAKYVFDPGDKKTVLLKALGKMTAFELKLPAAGGVDYALVATTGSNQESFRGTPVNYAPNDNKAPIMYTTGASRAVELAGQKIRVFDDNCDAKFGSDIIQLKDFKNQMAGSLPFMDSILIGGAKKAVPFSGFLKLGPKWYRFKPDSDMLGAKFQVRELDIKTGMLKVQWNGPAAFKPHYIVVQEVGEFSGAYFDLLSGSDKGLEVPAGEYEFFYGMYRSGKGRNYQKYAIIPPDQPRKFAVKPGETVTLTLGGPFTFANKTTMDSGEISIQGRSIEIRGAAGERYVLMSHEIPHPKLEWRKPGAKTGNAFAEMKPRELKESDPPDVLCFPADFKGKRPEAGPIEIRLVEEHKWFGPIASEWIK